MSIILNGKKLIGGGLNGRTLKEVWLNGKMIWPEKSEPTEPERSGDFLFGLKFNAINGVNAGEFDYTVDVNETHTWATKTNDNWGDGYEIYNDYGETDSTFDVNVTFSNLRNSSYEYTDEIMTAEPSMDNEDVADNENGFYGLTAVNTSQFTASLSAGDGIGSSISFYGPTKGDNTSGKFTATLKVNGESYTVNFNLALIPISS